MKYTYYLYQIGKFLTTIPIGFCYGDDILWLGVDHNIHDDTRNKPISKHAKYRNETNTKG